MSATLERKSQADLYGTRAPLLRALSTRDSTKICGRNVLSRQSKVGMIEQIGKRSLHLKIGLLAKEDLFLNLGREVPGVGTHKLAGSNVSEPTNVARRNDKS